MRVARAWRAKPALLRPIGTNPTWPGRPHRERPVKPSELTDEVILQVLLVRLLHVVLPAAIALSVYAVGDRQLVAAARGRGGAADVRAGTRAAADGIDDVIGVEVDAGGIGPEAHV